MYFFTVKHQSPPDSGESNIAETGASVPKLEKSVISKISKNAITTPSEILHKTETIEHTNNKDIDIVKI